MLETGPETVVIKVKRLPGTEDLPWPSYQTSGAVGMDLLAAVTAPVTLAPGERCLVPTGIALALPPGYEAQIRPRSGLALGHGVTLLNAPGTVDWDYRGEIKLILVNLGTESFVFGRGRRVAQMVIQRVVRAELVQVDELDDTRRQAGGFGHTGS